MFRRDIKTSVLTLALLFLLSVFAVPLQALELKPHKDRLFKNRKPIEVKDNGDFLRLPYDPKRDINKRDAQPVRKVKGHYVSSKPKRHEQDLSISANGRNVTYFGVGALGGNSKMTVIFLHGRDGSRHLGFSDEKFGGNFNRVKNLMFRNGGIYISSDFTNFEEEGRQDIEALVAHYRGRTSICMQVLQNVRLLLCFLSLRQYYVAINVEKPKQSNCLQYLTSKTKHICEHDLRERNPGTTRIESQRIWLSNK